MSGKTDIAKGRIKEAAGVLTGNVELREKGKSDQVVGNAKETVKKAVRKIEKVAQKTINKVKGAAE